MSTVAIKISENNTLHLWTNVSAWNPNEKFSNNQKYSQLPKTLDHLFYCFSESEVARLNNATCVSLPFAYWKSGNADCPSPANPIETRWQEGKNPNVLGRLIVPIEQAPHNYYSAGYNSEEHSHVLKNIGYTLQQVDRRAKQLEGYQNRLFSTFIPLSCKSVANSITSLFPWTQMTYRYDWTTPFRFVADIITLPFRLLTFLPRLLYQLLFTHPIPPFKAVALNGERVDWNSGALYLYLGSYGTGNPKSFAGGGTPDPCDYINCLRFHEFTAIYLG